MKLYMQGDFFLYYRKEFYRERIEEQVTKGRKLFSLLMALCMVLSVTGIAAFAADDVLKPEAGQNAEVIAPDTDAVKALAEKYFGSTEAFADFVGSTVGLIVTGAKSDNLAKAIVNAAENGVIIGDISKMTDAEVKTMLDQIYWVYADNPGPITQTVDCIKMYVNYVDASIHKGQDGPNLGVMQVKLATYYSNWLKEHCTPETTTAAPTAAPTQPVITPPVENPPTGESVAISALALVTVAAGAAFVLTRNKEKKD